MATLVEKKDPAAPFTSQVDEQLAQTTSRIRAHDLAFGGLILVTLVLVYTTAMILLDKYLVLAEWVRQGALAAFLAVFAATAYLTIISPLRKRINPLYAARQVERTIDDAKNSVTGFVDAQEKGDLNPTVKAALASRAAKAAAEADVNRAVDHNNLLYIGGVAVALLLALVVLFFIFRPAQFSSLVGRAFVPFHSDPIATRTQLAIVKPEPVEPTITTGQSILVAVHVGGKVPLADSPERVRLLVRHNQADPNYDEVPMVQGETSRDWEIRVPDYLVQNGFWYKVAAGDAVTPEYKVTVRSLPMFTDFQATYEYPKYLRRKNETANDPVIRAYRGTTVTLIAKANREVRDGLMDIEPGNARVAGTPVPGKPDSLQFVFKLTQSGTYKLGFNATNGERSADTFQSSIKVEADQPPSVVITKPEEDETTEPLNGQIKIDGKVGDDFGIDTVTLKLRIVEPNERPLPDVPYMNGKSASFRREKDDTWPTDLNYKGSVDLAKLTKDAGGLPLELKPDMVIEYWLEATDNCTEPKPNVGRSQPKRVRLTPPKMDEMDKQQLDQQKQERKNEEQKHNQQQKQKFDNEKRDKPQQNQNQKGDGQQPDQPEKKNDPNGANNPENKKPGNTQPDSKQPDKKQPDNKQAGDKNNTKPEEGKDPPKGQPETKPGDMGGMGNPMQNPMPKEGNDQQPMKPGEPKNMDGMGQQNNGNDPQQDNVKKTADEFQKEIEKDNENGGSPKNNPAPNEQERTDPGKAKPPPKNDPNNMKQGDTGNAAETKPEPKEPNPNDPNNKEGQKNSAPSSSKPEGNIEKPEDAAKSKPEPQQGNGNNGQKGPAPAEQRSEPLGAPPGADKEPPPESQPEPKDPNSKQDPKSGSAGKPSTQKKEGDQGGMPKPDDKQDPAGAAGSGPKPPMKDPTRGEDKPAQQPKGGAQPKGTPEPKGQPENQQGKPDAGDGKPDKAPPAAGPKPKPKDEPTEKGTQSEPKPEGDANDPKNPNGTGSADAKPDEPKKNPMGAKGGENVEKGMDKPQPQDKNAAKNPAGNGNKQKLDEKQLKELEEAAKDLNSSDPKKKEEAQKKLDKAIGEKNRKELEQLANDLKSDDKGKREAAQKKLDDLKKQMKDGQGEGEPKKEEGAKLDEKQKKELEDALRDLQSPDANKKQEAQKKLDKAIGEGQRKEIEQFMNDLKSDDKDKREAAQNKLEELKKQMEQARKDNNDKKNEPKGKEPPKEPSPEEINDLAKKAQDLQSNDSKTREAAEKSLDEKIGKENREKLQEEMKKKPNEPADPAKLKDQMKEWQQGLGSGTRAKGPMEDDKKNRLKTAELNLEQFESDKYREQLKAKKGWTDAEYEKFLRDYEDYIKRLRKEVVAGDKPPMAPAPGEPGSLLSPGGGNKVEGLPGATTGNAGVGGTTSAPPGFERAKNKFQDALKSKKQ